MRLLISVTVAALFALAPAIAVAGPDVIEPDWIAKPNGDDLSRAYPMLAQTFQIGGKAIISCQVDAFGKLKACKVDAETPANFGFGAAALSMAPAFQLRPQSVNGKFVEGGEVRIPLRFMLPYQPEPPPVPPPSSPRALELARKLVALSPNDDAAAAQIEGVASQLDRAKAIIPAYGQIATALRESYPPRAAQVHERSAALLANAFTADELALLVGYFSTPAGSRQLRPAEKDREMLAKFSRGLGRTALDRAREVFCQEAGCPKPEDRPFQASPTNPADSISAPVWSQQPSRETIQQFLPPAAKALHVPGGARLSCLVGPLGALTQCTVAGEAPKGLGLAMGVKSLAPFYRLSPEQLGQGAIGKRVAVEIWFTAEAADAVEPLPEIKARSTHAMSLARELMSLQDDGPRLQSALRSAMEDQRRLAEPSGLTSEEFDRFIDVLARGNRAAFEQRQEAGAAYLTTQMTDEQILAAIRFWRGPAGKAWKAKSAAVLAQGASAGTTYGLLVLADAGRAFCKSNDCEGMTLKAPAGPKPAQPPSSANSAPSTRTP